MAANPMHQFKVYKIGPEISISGLDLSFTNASLFMVISAFIIAVLFLQDSPIFSSLGSQNSLPIPQQKIPSQHK